MKELILPLVERVAARHKNIDLSNILIIGAQHILETTHSMFRSLYKLGLKPSNIHLIGKCYSTCEEVYHEMIEDGIDVSSGSFAYSSHLSYDEQYSKEVKFFLSKHLKKLESSKYDKIIFLDDGGKCINFLNKNVKPNCPIIAIEQTSAGYEAIRDKKLLFPVINVARSPVKLKLESPMIAQAAAERLYMSLKSRNFFPNKALIIGGGAIGKAMKDLLSQQIDITIYDINDKAHDKNLEELIGRFPLIIGCTGTTSVSHHFHKYLAPKTVLVSVSSSDREFDAVYLRRKITENKMCHSDLMIDDLFLVNNGFPVNFDGERENIHPDLIQLTLALIAGGILQGVKSSNLNSSIIPVCKDIEDLILHDFIGKSLK